MAPMSGRFSSKASRKYFPDREIVEIPDSDPIFHTIYDLDQRFQVPGAQYLRSGRTYEKDGYTAQLARNLRRQGPRHGRDLPQHGSWRRLGMVGRSALRREVFGPWPIGSV